MAEKLIQGVLPGEKLSHLFAKVGKDEHEPLCEFVVSVPVVEPAEKVPLCDRCRHLQLVSGKAE